MSYLDDKYPKLLELLEKCFANAKQYLELTEKAGACIAADDEKSLVGVLKERELLIKEIDSTKTDTDGALREYAAFSKKNSGRDKAEELLKSIRETYMQCLTLDQNNRRDVNALLKKATDDNKDLQKRREGINKYAQSDYIFAPSILDKHQ